MPVPMDVMLTQAVDNWLQANPQGKMNGTVPARGDIKQGVVDLTRSIIDAQNSILPPKSPKMKVPDRLTNSQIVRIIEKVEQVLLISCEKQESEETEFDLIGVYQYTGPDEGVYKTSDKALNQLIAMYNRASVKRDWNEVREMLRLRLERRRRCMDRDLIPVNNGIFDYKNKKLLPFDKDKVFLHKCKVNYNPQARNVIIVPLHGDSGVADGGPVLGAAKLRQSAEATHNSHFVQHTLYLTFTYFRDFHSFVITPDASLSGRPMRARYPG